MFAVKQQLARKSAATAMSPASEEGVTAATGLSADFSMIPAHSPQCVDGHWNTEYDGCSLPKWIATAYAVDADNPAGGKDTQFALRTPCADGGKACDCHDECYQTYPSNKATCDTAMKQQMLTTCQASAESNEVKTECYRWAYRYYSIGLQNPISTSAFKKRQAQVKQCQEQGTK